ncbi:thiopeptide-type bacteriocin biosynthesis protein [Flavobacterium sp. ALJ2]|uniref:thiopeptide-type bacteriocin biosynthesis protein n=1 Tax=Flavobacterium sp. ALJ2 TaxID=2786960 RepID=UPI00189D90D7|nr:thiopeptide-type bacteriocin biosynthesis protein [Flavobacterium sp. ALJ2]MBF7092716.1 thiopeptide-type bacteriocin biosynthesis protein [Flavobacterium sp. ALJ2]
MKRDFCLGSEWLYYKIYTGVKTADIVLIEKLYPIIFLLKERNLISEWFFIRYKDSDEHLRIRFLIDSPNKLAQIIALFYPVLNQLLEQNSIWKVQTDTYKREIERYGQNTMIDSEFIFWHDSEMVLKYLILKSEFVTNEMQLFFSFCAIDNFLNSFHLSNANKLKLMDELQLSFKEEFKADKTLKKEMDKQYRELFPEINRFLSGKTKNDYPEVFELIQEKQTQIDKVTLRIKENLQISLSSFLMSHIHMMVNRQYTSKQRMYELLIYDHLYRYYKTIAHQQSAPIEF